MSGRPHALGRGTVAAPGPGDRPHGQGSVDALVGDGGGPSTIAFHLGTPTHATNDDRCVRNDLPVIEVILAPVAPLVAKGAGLKSDAGGHLEVKRGRSTEQARKCFP